MSTKFISTFLPILIMALICTIYIIGFTPLNAISVNSILVTEIGAYETAGSEWIEIYNPTDSPIELTDLIFYENDTNHSTNIISDLKTLEPKKFGLILNKPEEFFAKHPEINLNNNIIIDSSWQSLSTEGETLSLKEADLIIEEITYPKLTEQKSLQRQYENNLFGTGWFTGIQENSILQVSESSEAETNEQKNDTTCPIQPPIIEYKTEIIEKIIPFIKFSEISIQDTENDWIEVYINTFGTDIDPVDISIELDKTNKFNETELINKNGFIIINTDLVGTSEQITIKYKDHFMDAICWSTDSPTASEQTDMQEMIDNEFWIGPCINSKEIKKDYTLVRTTFLNDIPSIENWDISKTKTKEKNNKLTPIESLNINSSEPTKEKNLSASKSTNIQPSIIAKANTNLDLNLQVVAFLPNPEGKDDDKEWITIKNISQENANLDGWKLDDTEGQSKEYLLTNLSLKPNETYTIYNSDSGITLNNTSDEIRILKPDDSVYKVLSYVDAKDNEIFINENDTWQRKAENQNPEVSTAAFYEQMPGDDPTETFETLNEGQTNLKLQLTEIMPNPKGADSEKEWLEIYNPTSSDTSIKNWKFKINDKEHLLKDINIKANSYTYFFTDFSITNTKTKLVLLDHNNNIIDSGYYNEAYEDQSYMKNPDGEWKWTSFKTPGSANPVNIEIEGIIKKVDLNKQTITVDDKTLIFENKDMGTQFKEGYEVTLDVIKNNDKYYIAEIFSIGKPQNESNKKIDPLIIIGPILIITSIIFRKKIKNLLINKF